MSSQLSSSSSSSSADVVVVGFGGVCLDLLAVLSSFPKPDDKTSCRSMTIQGGGGAGNTATCLSRLGLQVRLMSKLGDDFQGRTAVEELQADNVDTSFIVVDEGGRSPFSYIIVEKKTNTRTCILTRGDPPMVPKDVIPSQLESALTGACLTYFDGRYPHAGQIVARESARKGIPILVDAEKRRDGLDGILDQSDYAVCKMKFLEAWTGESSMPSAMISLLLRLPKLRFVIVTLGENGCIMLERCLKESPASEEDIGRVLESLKQRGDKSTWSPFCISSPVTRMKAEGIGTMVGRLLLGTAEKIPPTELVDTTGAGDAFIGGIIYGLCTAMPSERMLPFASKVAAEVCRSMGARAGLPRMMDPCLSSLLL